MFATTADLTGRWRTLTNAETTKADLFLADVERDLVRAYPDLPTRAAADVDFTAELTRITCNVVRRRMTGEEFEGLESNSETQGPYGRTRRFRDQGDDLEVTAYERRILAGAVHAPSATGSPTTAAWSNEP